MSTHFNARATFSDGWWSAEIDVPGKLVFTEAKRLDRLEEMARDAVATALNTSKEEVRVDVHVHVDDETDAAVSQARELSAQAAVAMREAGTLNRQVAHQLKSRGLSARDSGRIMGISPQRISQLLAQ